MDGGSKLVQDKFAHIGLKQRSRLESVSSPPKLGHEGKSTDFNSQEVCGSG